MTTVIFYVGMEGIQPGGRPRLECANQQNGKEFEGIVEFQGDTSGLGGFKIHVQEPKMKSYPTHTDPNRSERPHQMTSVKSMVVPEDMIWQAKCECCLLSYQIFCGLGAIPFAVVTAICGRVSKLSISIQTHPFKVQIHVPINFKVGDGKFS
jgi:hypothetical protein